MSASRKPEGDSSSEELKPVSYYCEDGTIAEEVYFRNGERVSRKFYKNVLRDETRQNRTTGVQTYLAYENGKLLFVSQLKGNCMTLIEPIKPTLVEANQSKL